MLSAILSSLAMTPHAVSQVITVIANTWTWDI